MTLTTDRSSTSSASSADVVIRTATADDAPGIYRLIHENLAAGHLLARPLGEVELHVPHFVIAADGDQVIGCGELTRLSASVAEVRSLVVAGPRRGRGLGARLLEALVDEAVTRRVPRVCAFTHGLRPFVQAGFSIVPHPWVPAKIATDCQACDLFRRCDRYAVILDLRGAREQTG